MPKCSLKLPLWVAFTGRFAQRASAIFFPNSAFCFWVIFLAPAFPPFAWTTTTHIERFFLTVRQELKRFQRLGLGYSKDLDMHKAATALIIGTYNLVRKHTSLDGQTPAQAAGIEEKRWTMVDVVELTARYVRAKEDAKFEAAFAVNL